MLSTPLNNEATIQRHVYAERTAAPPIFGHSPVPPNTQTNMPTTSSFVQDSLAAHNRRVERGEILPFLPSPEPLLPEDVRRTTIDWGAIGDSANDDEVPWSPEGAGRRETDGSTWDEEQTVPTDKLAGELDSMMRMKKRKRDGSESEYVGKIVLRTWSNAWQEVIC